MVYMFWEMGACRLWRTSVGEPPSRHSTRPLARRVTMIEAKELLGSFDGSLREYAARKLTRQGIRLRKVGCCAHCARTRTMCA